MKVINRLNKEKVKNKRRKRLKNDISNHINHKYFLKSLRKIMNCESENAKKCIEIYYSKIGNDIFNCSAFCDGNNFMNINFIKNMRNWEREIRNNYLRIFCDDIDCFRNEIDIINSSISIHENHIMNNCFIEEIKNWERKIWKAYLEYFFENIDYTQIGTNLFEGSIPLHESNFIEIGLNIQISEDPAIIRDMTIDIGMNGQVSEDPLIYHIAPF